MGFSFRWSFVAAGLLASAGGCTIETHEVGVPIDVVEAVDASDGETGDAQADDPNEALDADPDAGE